MTPPDATGGAAIDVAVKRRRNGATDRAGQPIGVKRSETTATKLEPAVEETGQSGRSQAAIAAHVDTIDASGHLRGWAWIPDDPRRRVGVTAHLGRDIVSFATANLFRSDVQQAG